VTRLPQQGLARYTGENTNCGEEVVILQMSCSGDEPVEFMSTNCLEARLVSINIF
jgi:hypothetical protein